MIKQFFLSACALALMAATSSGQVQSASSKPARSMVSINEVTPITADIVLSATGANGTKQPDRQGH